MTTPSRTCRLQGCKVEIPETFNDKGLCLNHYLDEATRSLEDATTHFRNEQNVDHEALAWLLAQIDFVIETMGEETLLLDPDQRSRLLELLLGIANLNEFVHHHVDTLRQIK